MLDIYETTLSDEYFCFNQCALIRFSRIESLRLYL